MCGFWVSVLTDAFLLILYMIDDKTTTYLHPWTVTSKIFSNLR